MEIVAVVLVGRDLFSLQVDVDSLVDILPEGSAISDGKL